MIFFTLCLLVVFRLGGQVRIPGVLDPTTRALDFSGNLSILELYDTFVGGFFSQDSIFTFASILNVPSDHRIIAIVATCDFF